jgi:hypothetical protein
MLLSRRRSGVVRFFRSAAECVNGYWQPDVADYVWIDAHHYGAHA